MAAEAVHSLSADASDFSLLSEARPFALYLSAGSGYGAVWGAGYSDAPAGPHVLLSFLGAARIRRWEIDGGVSWLYSSINGQASQGVPVSVRTRAGTFDVGARYRIGSSWQVGPAFNLAYGTDTSFGPSIRDSHGTLLMGLKAMYEPPRVSFPLRFWIQASTDTAFEHPLAVGLAGLQIGIPVRIPGKAAGIARVQDPKSDAVTVTQAAPDKQVRIVLDSQKVFFGTSSFALKPEVRAALRGVGQYLTGLPEQPSQIKISGHADQRGRYEYNLKLSRRRAESVRDALQAGGAASRSLEVAAFSYLLPLDKANNRVAWAKNRRVEIVFENVQDPAGLRNQLNGLATDSPKESQ